MHRQFRYVAILAMLLSAGLVARAEMRIATDDAMKAATKRTPPDYPPIARQLKIGGRVEVEVTIDAEGNVENIKIVSGNAMLTQSVVSAVKKWKFTPFMQEGAPSKAVTELEFTFKL